jgi:hypothetical protein
VDEPARETEPLPFVNELVCAAMDSDPVPLALVRDTVSLATVNADPEAVLVKELVAPATDRVPVALVSEVDEPARETEPLPFVNELVCAAMDSDPVPLALVSETVSLATVKAEPEAVLPSVVVSDETEVAPLPFDSETDEPSTVSVPVSVLPAAVLLTSSAETRSTGSELRSTVVALGLGKISYNPAVPLYDTRPTAANVFVPEASIE